jgi:prolyl oligopeptidase
MNATRIAFPSLSVSATLMLGIVVTAAAQAGKPSPPQPPPAAPVKPVIDHYHGAAVTDPYRYMENVDDPAVRSWMKAQDEYTRAMLARIPGRQGLLSRIQELDNAVPRVSARLLPGDQYLILKHLPGEVGLFNLYRRLGLSGRDSLLVDPEKIRLQATSQSRGKNEIWGWAVSNDRRYIAVGIVPGGSELDGELHVIEIATARETGDVIRHVGAEAWEPYWLPDDRSFVYGHLQKLPPGAPAAETRQKFRSYLHVLGTDTEKDIPVFGYGVVPSIDVDPSLIASVRTQPDSRYALGVLNGSVTRNSAYYIAPVSTIGKAKTEWRKVADFADGVTDVTVHGDDLYVLTYKDTPRFKILRLDAPSPDLASAEVVVPASEAVITGMEAAGDGLYVRLLDGGMTGLLRVPYGRRPKVERVSLPFAGAFYPWADPRVPGVLLTGVSWTRARQVFLYDPATKRVSNTGIAPAGPYDNPDNIESVEVKATSADGTLVPLSIVYPKGIKMDGSNPTLLEGYGGYGYTMEPDFRRLMLVWFEKGGIQATCHVRGGGEYGEEWHLAGKGQTKPNTWRDFIACAQYLIDHRYTSPPRLAGEGTSAGGILIGRAITERPDLFGAAIDNVGLSDTLRFELTQNGETNIPELGSTKTEAGFKALYAMSPYEHVEHQTAYPAVLLKTGLNDPRVDPWQMAKMTARLQAATSSQKPILLRVDSAGGHGGGSTSGQLHESLADELSFLFWQLGVGDFQPR